MYCPINHLEGMMNDARDKGKNTMQDLAREDLAVSMLETILSYRENIKDPRLQAELRAKIDEHNKAIMEMDLKTENDKFISTAHIEKDIAKFNTEFENYLIKERMTGTGDPSSLGTKVLNFLNKNYKGMTIGPAMGRVIMESAQGGLTAFIEAIDTMRNFKVPEGLKMPEAGNINKKVKFSAREFQNDGSIFGSNLLKGGDTGGKLDKVLSILSKPSEALMKMQAGIMDPALGKIENYMYHSLFQKKMIERAMEIDGYKGPTSEWTPGKSAYLFKDNITSANQVRKNHIIQEVKRKARTEASKMFFNYTENPLFVQKMEQIVPFTNYMYSGVRLLSRYPKSLMFTAVMLNNLQSAYGENVWYTDDEGEKIDAGISLRFPALASIGLGGVGLNAQKIMSFSPANTTVSPLPLFSWLTNREDFRFKTFYQSGKVDDLIDAGLSTMGGTIGRIFKGLKNLDDPYDPKYNPVADITSSLFYMATGVPLKDKTQAMAAKAYFTKDLDFLLNLSDMQLNQFFKRPGKEGLTRKSLEMAKEAMDLGLITKDWKQDPYRTVLEAITGMGIVENSFSKEDYQHTTDMMSNMLEVVLGKQFASSNGDFETFLGKAVEFASRRDFKHFQAFNPKLYETYKHFADNKEYYYGQGKAYKLLGSQDDKERAKGTAMLFAVQYRFKGDDEMSVEEKTNAIMSGKLKEVLMSKGDPSQGIPAGPMMTEQYFNSMDHKGDLTMNYLNQANEVIALTKARKLFTSLAYVQTSQDKKNMYFDLANSVYNKEKIAFERFKKTGTPEFAIYTLSNDYGSFQSKMERANAYMQNAYRQRAKVEVAKFDRLVGTSTKEKEALKLTFGLDTDRKAVEMARQMLSDSSNQHYYQLTKNPEKLSSIINDIK